MTAHAPAGLPELYRTGVTAELAERLLSDLTCERTAFITEAELTACLAARQGNLRDAFFDLYDLHERRQRMAIKSACCQ